MIPRTPENTTRALAALNRILAAAGISTGLGMGGLFLFKAENKPSNLGVTAKLALAFAILDELEARK